jgi:hypothetical protein
MPKVIADIMMSLDGFVLGRVPMRPTPKVAKLVKKAAS